MFTTAHGERCYQGPTLTILALLIKGLECTCDELLELEIPGGVQ